jgi:hypothetical protein
VIGETCALDRENAMSQPGRLYVRARRQGEQFDAWKEPYLAPTAMEIASCAILERIRER